MNTEKVYCYVDESGQDTKGTVFVVTVVIVGKERNLIRKILEDIEKSTGKKKTKWMKSKKELKTAYFEKIIDSAQLKELVFCSVVEGSVAYRDTTVVAIASAINEYKNTPRYKASVFIDGLKKTEVKLVGLGLRRVGIHVEKVRGVRDESDALVRLADSVAGLTRANFEKVDFAEKIFRRAVRRKIINLL